MKEKEFFKEIEHVEIPWGERSIWVPIFYRDTTSIGALFAAPQEKLKASWYLVSHPQNPDMFCPHRKVYPMLPSGLSHRPRESLHGLRYRS